MTETMGPREAECPAAILDLLTPTQSEYALDWRRRCREFTAWRASRPKLRDGDRLTFDEAIAFTDGSTHQSLTVSISPLRPRAIRLLAANGMLYRISGLRDRAFRVERTG